MRIRVVLAAIAALFSVIGVAIPPAASAETERPQYPVMYNVIPGVLRDISNPGTPPLGANDWGCKPSAEHPNPVVLVHGVLGTAGNTWGTMSPLLANNGYCVFALTYGARGNPPFVAGLNRMEESAKELAAFIDRVRETTGAAKVDLVGHSQGTLMPQYYLKRLGGAPNVQRYVAFTPLYDGTELHGASGVLDAIAKEIPYARDITGKLICDSCWQFLKDSDFLRDINNGGTAVPGIEYTTIMTKHDEVVTPYTSGELSDGSSPNNVVLQDECALDFSEHLSAVADANAAQFMLNALDPANAQPVKCFPVFPVLGGGPVHTGPRPVL
jgi:triacylglycerol lipase